MTGASEDPIMASYQQAETVEPDRQSGSGLNEKPAPDGIAAQIEALAKLDPIAFDQVRKAKAEEWGIRASVLDAEVKKRRSDEKPSQGRALELPEPEPWSEPVIGDALLSAICAATVRHVALPVHCAETVALWVVQAHAVKHSFITPRLALTSPEKRCGKTTLLRIIMALVTRPLMAGNISAPAFFRTIEAARPSLGVDEADTFLRDNEELRGIINTGHSKDGNVVRCVGEDFEARQFSTWAAVVIACIGSLPATIADRSIHIPMRRRRQDEPIVRLRIHGNSLWPELASKAARWVADHGPALEASDPAIPEELNDRAADNWRPLLAIADAASGKWPAIARKAAIALSGEADDETESARILLLQDIREIFAAMPEPVEARKIASADLVAHLAVMDSRPWPEWKHGRPITARQVAKLLTAFKVKPGTIRLPGGGTPKGYVVADFADAFARYLPSIRNSRHNAGNIEENGENTSATNGECGGYETGELFNGNNTVAAVADETPPTSGDNKPAPPELPWESEA